MTREQSVITTKQKLRKATSKEEYAEAFISHFKKYDDKKKDPTTEELVSMLSGGLTLDDCVVKDY